MEHDGSWVDVTTGAEQGRLHNAPQFVVAGGVVTQTYVVARMRAHGAELVGEVAQYEDVYRLCYLRGPDGIIVALAEQLD